MKREQVKQELRELKSIVFLSKNGIEAIDTKGLKEKYEKAISEFEHIDQVIFVEVVFNNKTQLQISFELHYSQEGIRKRWSKIIDKLANMLEIKRTNFDRIAESVEILAQFLSEHIDCDNCFKDERLCGALCVNEIIEWLQKESE